MKNFIAAGMLFPFTASGADIVSGQGVLSGTLFGIATGDIADGETGEMQTNGVFELPKTASQAWTVGAAIYWTGSEATTVATDNTLIGVAYAAVGSGATETLGCVRLNGVPA